MPARKLVQLPQFVYVYDLVDSKRHLKAAVLVEQVVDTPARESDKDSWRADAGSVGPHEYRKNTWTQGLAGPVRKLKMLV